MGGSPSISGGMTMAEQQKLMAEEREFQAQQENERRIAAEAAEVRREKRERDERERIKQEENIATKALADAEREAQLEAAAEDETKDDAGTIQGQNEAMLDFYSNLYRGSGG